MPTPSRNLIQKPPEVSLYHMPAHHIIPAECRFVGNCIKSGGNRHSSTRGPSILEIGRKTDAGIRAVVINVSQDDLKDNGPVA
jgi:hypothetical protein